ncbi:Calcium-transporting ATPase 4, endoplasmic reticulum-type [Dionaea muscipula]
MGKGGQNLNTPRAICANNVVVHESDVFRAWSKDPQECERYYEVDRVSGLSSGDVEKRRQVYGFNELDQHDGQSLWRLILVQFNDTLVRVLLGAATVSFVVAMFDDNGTGDEITKYAEPVVIFLILIANAIVGVWQEGNAEKALEALQEIQSDQAAVVRDGKRIPNLPAKELVPGDIVELKVGDKVPADLRVLELISSPLRVEQGSLTGESEAVNKSNKPVPADADIQGKKCMVFAGTTVVNGNCICLVTHTGMETELGKVHTQIHIASQIEDETPLKKKLNEFGETLTVIIGVICALVWAINLRYFLSWEYNNDGGGWPRNFRFSFEKCAYYFEVAVALAVAAIPEGLPAVITTCLALGTRKMAQKNALVRKLPSVETLGCTTVICSDKTGTLTTNQMAVAKLVATGQGGSRSRSSTTTTTTLLRSFKVDGSTYNPSDGKIHGWPTGAMDSNLEMIAKIAALCNDANVVHSENKFVTSGMPTEAALKILVEKMGLPQGWNYCLPTSNTEILRCCRSLAKAEARLATLEFDRDRKSMGVIVNSLTGKKLLLVKGAVENVLERSTSIQLLDGTEVDLDSDARSAILGALHEMSTSSLRCLAFAYKDSPPEFETYDGSEDHPAHQLLLDPTTYSSIETKLTFVGLVGLRDPPRAEVHQAIEDCRTAGIRVVVITGDNMKTAEAICREIGVFGPTEDVTSKSISGKEFMHLPDQKAFLRGGQGGLLISRAEPRHKQEIVRLLKEDGEVVAMTGDGVNDAPALKLADIGIAMGISGTEVAKEASDMVLADDNFSTIVAAVGEGRSIYNNMKAFIRYMISSNIGEVATIFLTAALGIPEGLIPVQLLWVNLVTDGPPATALGFNPPDKDVMKKPPRATDDSLITAWMLFRYLVVGLYVGVATVGIFVIWYTRSSFLGIDLGKDGHSLVSYNQLANWDHCSSWGDNFTVSPFTAGHKTFTFDDNPCNYFEGGKVKAKTLSLSTLVAIEMFNSLNALSEDQSLLTLPPWANPWLLLAMSISFSLHFLILYVPFLAHVFGTVPLSFSEWLLVLIVAFPVIIVDEILKFTGRTLNNLRASDMKKTLKTKIE